MADNEKTETGQATGEPGSAEVTEKTEDTPKPSIDWKAESRKWESRAKDNLAAAKANQDAAKRLKEIEEASKTEAQKNAERLAELEGQVQDYKNREQIAAWKAEVAESTGVPASVLAGGTLEEITAHAESLKPLLAQPAPSGPVVPVEGTGGGGGASQLSKSDLESMTPEQVNQARREGRLNRVLGIT